MSPNEKVLIFLGGRGARIKNEAGSQSCSWVVKNELK